MSNKICSVCLRRIENEDAPVLAMGSYGTPRLLCDECAEHIENMTRGRDYDAIIASMDAISERMSRANIDDKVTLDAVTNLLVSSAKRASEIKDGSYDFALDEVEEEDYEIPEELKESEEDRALDEKEKRSTEKMDKVMNFVWLGVIIAMVGLVVWWLFF